MATEAVVFFESHLTADDLPLVPQRLVAECPAFRRLFDSWGWPLDASSFQWTPALEHSGFHQCTAAEAWPKRRPVTLFGPGGHFHFGPSWLEWATETKWTWLFIDEDARAKLIEVSTQLASLVRSDVALVTGDWGADDAIKEVLEAGGTVRDAIAAVSREGPPFPLEQVPFVAPDVYPRRWYGAYFLLRFQ